MQPETKVCYKCKIELPFNADFFPRNRNAKYRLAVKCRKCQSTYVVAWQRGVGKEKHRSIVRKCRAGFTQQEFDQKLAEQGGVCAVCKQPPSESRTLDSDHCHASGVKRGLLCNKCNQALGLFNDSPLLLQAALDYPEKFAVNKISAPARLPQEYALAGSLQ